MSSIPSSDQDLWPDAWRRRPEKKFYLSLSLVAFVALAALAVAWVVSADEPVRAAYAAAFAGLLILVVWGGYETRFRLRRSGAAPIRSVRVGDKRALKIPYSWRLHVVTTAAMTWIALGFAIATIHYVAAEPPDERQGAYLTGLLAIIFGSFPLLLLRGKYALGYVLVSPEGIYQRGWTFEAFLPWERTKGVSAQQTDGPDILVVGIDGPYWKPRQLTRLWRTDRLNPNPTPALHIPGKFMAADPAIVLAILVHYGLHGEDRPELTTEEAIERVRSRNFDHMELLRPGKPVAWSFNRSQRSA